MLQPIQPTLANIVTALACPHGPLALGQDANCDCVIFELADSLFTDATKQARIAKYNAKRARNARRAGR